MGFLNTIANSLLNIVFPAKCVSCGRSGSEFCMSCLSECPAAERECAKWIFPIFDYRHPPVKKALWLLKYKGKKNLTTIFAEALEGRMLEELSELSLMENFRKPMLIPIPLSPARYRARGYNQTELLCKELYKISPELELAKDILIKIKDTEHQARIKDRSARLKNLVGSFAVRNVELIKNRNVILIDDVITTGATLSEARKILKQHGARKIIALTIAH